MIGKHFIEIQTPRLKYKIILERNISIIKGLSGTGKSTFIELFKKVQDNKYGKAMVLNSSANIRVLPSNFDELKYYDNDIIFIGDEDINYIMSKDFAGYVKESGKYFLLITRYPLKCLPYSTKSIYRFRTNWEEGIPYTVNEELFDSSVNSGPISNILTEGSNSGNQMINLIYSDDKYNVKSVNGNSSVLTKLQSMKGKTVCVIDGAAFGPYIDNLYNYIKYNRMDNSLIWMPESFEYLLLKAGIVHNSQTKTILGNPSKYIDSKDYLSWERYFTKVVTDICKTYGIVYSKEELPEVFKSESIVEKFKAIMPYVIRP